MSKWIAFGELDPHCSWIREATTLREVLEMAKPVILAKEWGCVSWQGYDWRCTPVGDRLRLKYHRDSRITD